MANLELLDLPDDIVDLQDEDENYNLLVYADSGVGKTVFGCSDDRVLVVATEDAGGGGGTISAKRFGSTAQKWKVKSWTDIVRAYDWLSKQDPIPFDWVFIDSLTDAQSMCMRDVLEKATKENPHRDPDVPLIGDWQPYYNKFERMVKLFNSLPVHCLYSALQQEEQDEEEETVVLPMLQGKGTQYAKKVASWMTSFGNMRVRRRPTGETDDDGKKKYEEVRVIQWAASKSVMAKDRTRCLEPRTVNLNLKEVRELLESGPKPSTQPGRVVKRPKANDVVRDEPKAEESVNGESEVNEEDLVTAGEDWDK
jgi:hypothetical protein